MGGRSGSRAAQHAPVDLPERHRRILALLVRQYVERGEPVSSIWLARESGLGLSSATVRNILARLEEWGCVHQPHTSAGRVPTDLGYRCYVDLLLQSRRRGRPDREVEARLRQAGSVEDVLTNVSHELSRVSHHVGFALGNAMPALRHIDFLSLDAGRILVVVVGTDGNVSHKVVRLPEVVRPHELQQAANYLNIEFAGLLLSEVRAAVEARLREERTLYDQLLSRALRLASATLQDLTPHDTLFIQGTSSLLDALSPDEGRPALATLGALFRMIEEKHRLVRLLNEYIDGPGLTVVIGTEHATPDLKPFSLVASTYGDGGRTGTVGVIGPTRMRYSHAITVVDGVASAVSRVLQRTN